MRKEKRLTNSNKRRMIKHVVTFKLKGSAETRREASARFKEALMALPQQIEVLKSMEVGLNVNPAEDWDVVLTATVATLADVDVYARHPAHLAAAAIVGPLKESRACVDYEI